MRSWCPQLPAICWSTSSSAQEAACPALRIVKPVTDGQAPAGGTEGSHSAEASSLDVCGLWTMGHGGSSGQNRLSSVTWSEAQTSGGGKSGCGLSLPFLPGPGILAQTGSAPLSCCKAQEGTVQPAQVLRLLTCQAHFRTGQSPSFQPLVGVLCIQPGPSSFSTLPHFLPSPWCSVCVDGRIFWWG